VSRDAWGWACALFAVATVASAFLQAPLPVSFGLGVAAGVAWARAWRDQ
jgi:hypothetical protein